MNNDSNNTLVSGTSGNDTISTTGYEVTINAGAGNDSITIAGGSAVIEYAGGNDVISGVDSMKALHITSGSISGASTGTPVQLIGGAAEDYGDIDSINAASYQDVINVVIADDMSILADVGLSGTLVTAINNDAIQAYVDRYITTINGFLTNRTDADGKAVSSSTATLAATALTGSTYGAASSSIADVKAAMNDKLDSLNSIFASQTVYVADEDVYKTMRIDLAVADGNVLTDYSGKGIDSDSTITDMRSLLSDRIKQLNALIQSIKYDVDTDADSDAERLKNTLYISGVTASESTTTTSNLIRDLKTISFKEDGSDIIDQYDKLRKLAANDIELELEADDDYLEYASGTALECVMTAGLEDVIALYNMIKSTAYYITSYDNEGDEAFDADLYNPFFATTDDSGAEGRGKIFVANVASDFFGEHDAVSENRTTYGYSNLDTTRITDIGMAFDSATRTAATNSCTTLINAARSLYNHLQATAYRSTISSSNLAAVESDDYYNLLDLMPGGAEDGIYASVVSYYKAAAALTDYVNAKNFNADVIVTVGSSHITLKDAADHIFTVINANGRAYDTIVGSATMPSVNLTINTTSGGTVTGSANDDVIENIGGKTRISVGSGNDYVYNIADSVSIYAGNDDDLIDNNGGASVTIDAGLGNDTISLNGGSARIKYTSGDGSDIIIGIDSDDTLQITSGTFTATTVPATRLLALEIDSDTKYINETLSTRIKQAIDENEYLTLIGSTSGDETTASYDENVTRADIAESIAAVNAYLVNRANADGKEANPYSAPTLSADALKAYGAASNAISDVKIALANQIDSLNAVFSGGNFQLINVEEGDDSISKVEQILVTAVKDDEISDYLKPELEGNYTIEADTSIAEARRILANIISDINRMLRSIVDDVSTDSVVKQANTIYTTGQRNSLTSVQFAEDGSDLFTKYVSSIRSLNATLSAVGGSDFVESAVDGARADAFLYNNGFEDAISVYNFIKAKAYIMTNVDSDKEAFDDDVYNPFFAAIDDLSGYEDDDLNVTIATIAESFLDDHAVFDDDTSRVGFCNISSKKYNELLAAFDDTTAATDYTTYYNAARALYNHLQSTAATSGFALDGSDLAVINSSEYQKLLELLPNSAKDDFIEMYQSAAAALDYMNAVNFDSDTSPYDVLIGIGDATITLKNFNDTITVLDSDNTMWWTNFITTVEADDPHKINSTVSNESIVGTGENDTINNKGDNVTLSAGEGDDTINNSGKNVTINAGSGDNTITNSGNNVSIVSGSDTSSINNTGATVTIDASSGLNTINNSGNNVSINSGAGANSIDNSGNNVTINAGSGLNTINNSGGRVTISGGSSINNISNSSLGSYAYIDGDAGNDNLVNAAQHVTLIGGAGSDFVSNSGASASIVVGNSSETTGNTVDNSGSNTTIIGAAGNDSIKNGGASVISFDRTVTSVERGHSTQ